MSRNYNDSYTGSGYEAEDSYTGSESDSDYENIRLYMRPKEESEDSGSDSRSDSGSDSGSESGVSESEYSYDTDTINTKNKECRVKYDMVMPQLELPCLMQHLPEGKKCFRGRCLDVIKLISVSDQTSSFGNIVEVSNGEEEYIVKWNRYRSDVSEFKNEVKIQRAAYTLGVGPKILQIYEQKSTKSRGGYIYIFMEDLISKGYRSISEYYGKYSKGKQVGFRKSKYEVDDIPRTIIVDISRKLKRLHTLGIAHRDLHPGNVFTNGQDVIFIDYGLSKHYADAGEAWRNEKYSTTRTFITSEGTHYTNLIPNNWKDIKKLTKPY